MAIKREIEEQRNTRQVTPNATLTQQKETPQSHSRCLHCRLYTASTLLVLAQGSLALNRTWRRTSQPAHGEANGQASGCLVLSYASRSTQEHKSSLMGCCMLHESDMYCVDFVLQEPTREEANSTVGAACHTRTTATPLSVFVCVGSLRV